MSTPAKPPIDYVLGLDLAKSQDYTALAVLERTWIPEPGHDKRKQAHYGVRHLRRWKLGTSYPAIIDEVAALVQTPPLEHRLLAVDQTDVGSAVVDMFRQAQLKAASRPVLITAGQETTCDGEILHVPKKELVSTLQALLQTRRLKVAAIPERELPVRELQAFRVKVPSAATETFESWRERDHDDLVLAVALACWLGQRSPPFQVPEQPVFPKRVLGPDSGREHPGARRGWFGR